MDCCFVRFPLGGLPLGSFYLLETVFFHKETKQPGNEKQDALGQAAQDTVYIAEMGLIIFSGL